MKWELSTGYATYPPMMNSSDSNTIPTQQSIHSYRIALARQRDIPLLPAIELAAATLLAPYAPASILAEATSITDLNKAMESGHLWVALADDVPVGFAHVKLLEPGAAHLEELDVHPDHGRRGIGRRLVTAVCGWAATAGYASVTLSTFRDVPWNMPFYASAGFQTVHPNDVSAALRLVVDNEARRGLDVARRVVMWWPVG